MALLREPETLERICSFIAEKGTLAGWCRSVGGAIRYQKAYEWLHDDAERLKRYVKAMEARQSALQDTVVDGMRESSEADIRELYDGQGKALDPHRLPAHMARVVNKVKVTRKAITVGKGEDAQEIGEEVTTEYGLDSRVASREQLGKHLGMFKDNVVLGGAVKVDEVAPEESARRIAFALAAAMRSAQQESSK